MKTILKAGVAAAALAIAMSVTTDKFAADLGGFIEDGYVGLRHHFDDASAE